MEPAIVLDQVSKRYYLGNRLSYAWDLLPNLFHRPLRRIGVIKTEDLWAVQDVSLEVMPGESLGIIGANGSGKTTLLSLMAGITEPTRGRMTVRGKIGALIALGAGFHAELTGRENVYLNGAILGLRKAEIDELYDRIVDFAELEPFMDTPVKRYSSGMYARLGFSVAAHIDPEVLLVDEVLSVGDINFQNKCIRHMTKLLRGGQTVVFVSHNMVAVQALCRRVIWLDHGQVRSEGQPLEVIRQYVDAMNTRALEYVREYFGSATRRGTGEVRFMRVVTTDGEGKPCDRFSPGQTLRICATYRAMCPVQRLIFNFTIQDRTSATAVTSVNVEPQSWEGLEAGGERTIVCEFPNIPLRPGIFSLYLGMWPMLMSRPYDIWDGAGGDFMVVSADHTVDSGMFVEYNQGLVSLPYRILHDEKTTGGRTDG